MTKREVIHAVLELGREEGHIFAAAYCVVGAEVVLENMLAFIDLVQGPPGRRKSEEDMNG